MHYTKPNPSMIIPQFKHNIEPAANAQPLQPLGILSACADQLYRAKRHGSQGSSTDESISYYELNLVNMNGMELA